MKESMGKTIGIPRAMLYYRYKTLWETFFDELGFLIKISGPTSKKTLDEGAAIAMDESCLSMKIFMGHVKELTGSSDYILVPRICNFGLHQEFCTRFQALYDVTGTIFRDSGQKFLTYSVNVQKKNDERNAFIGLGKELGFPEKTADQAYKKAKDEEKKQWDTEIQKQEQLLKEKGMKILIAGHSYLTCDSYIGKAVTDFLKQSGAIPIRGDLVDRDAALKASLSLSPTCKWQMSRELLGSIAMYREQVDGIILLTAFPCGPDSMVDELIVRRVKGIPILNLVMDAQDGTAGIETRLESFIDIIRFKEGTV